jgi:hypothetical protein
MAYYKYSVATRELVEVSDFSLSPEDDTPVSEIDISKHDLLELYQWDKESLGFVNKVQRVISKKNFLKRLTPNEYVAIKTAASQNGYVDYFWQLFLLVEEVNLDDPDTVVGLGLLVQAGLLNSNRIQEILA